MFDEIDIIPEWHDDASCVGRWEIFDGEFTGGSPTYADKAAKRICMTECTVREICLRDAMKSERGERVRYTIRGGLFPSERVKLAATWK